jgi:hypothetical protein
VTCVSVGVPCDFIGVTFLVVIVSYWGVTILWESFIGQIGPVGSISHNKVAALPFT